MSRTRVSPSEPGSRLELVDSLRAIAALTVFAFHIAFFLGFLTGHSASPYLRQLNVGVVIFFVVSGFLLYRPFVRARLERRPSPHPGRYGLRRAMRIVPAYWVALPVSAAVLGLHDVLTVRHGPVYFGFLQIYDLRWTINGLGQAWTLCVEASFYLLLPLIAWAMRRLPGDASPRALVRGELVMVGVLVLVGLVWNPLAAHHAADNGGLLDPAGLWLPAHIDHFALGMALAVITVAPPSPRGEIMAAVVGRRAALMWLGALGSVLAAGWVSTLDLGASATAALEHELRGLCALLIVAPVVLGAGRAGAVRRALASPVLLWLGLVSYGIYLWSPLLIDQLTATGLRAATGAAAVTVVALAATAVVAGSSWYLLERHAIAFGRSFSQRAGTGATAPAEDRAGAP